MLDLRLKERYYEIMEDGEVIKIKEPSQRLLNKVVQAQDSKDINTIYELVLEILNNNVNGKVFTEEQVELIDIGTVSILFKEYFAFVNEVLGE